jgi:nucleotide-binding universal stress UspA family protein
MHEDFGKIMALVDFTELSLHAAEEAAIIAAKFNGELHLVHFPQNSSMPYLADPKVYVLNAATTEQALIGKEVPELMKLKSALKTRYGVEISLHVPKGDFSSSMNELIRANLIDLTVIGIKRQRSIKEYFFGSKAGIIIDSVDCEVLCVYPETDCSNLKKIVIPVGKFIPKRKIRLAYKLARKFAANIHLIALSKTMPNENDSNSKILMAAYQYVKDITNIPVVCKTVAGPNLAKAVINYSKKIKADLILVNPGIESQIQGTFLRKRIGDIINYSSIPVLSVHAMANNE